jgi:Ca2+-binding EF-hand superfamily protein
MVSKLVAIVAGAGLLGTGAAGGYAVAKTLNQPVYGNEKADKLAKAADADKDGVLQAKELADMLKEMGYKGAPIPEGVAPMFQVGGTKELEVTVVYFHTKLSVRVPDEVADKYLEKHK